MNSVVNSSSPPIMSEIESISAKRCSHLAAQSHQVDASPTNRSRNPLVLQRIVTALEQYYAITPQTKQDIFELAVSLLNGNLETMRRTANRFQREAQQLRHMRDILSGVLALVGENTVQFIQSEVVKVQLASGKKVEVVYLSLMCTRTKEAVCIPSHPDIPVEVYHMTSIGPETAFWQHEKLANSHMVFRRLSSLIGNMTMTAPPPATRS